FRFQCCGRDFRRLFVPVVEGSGEAGSRIGKSVVSDGTPDHRARLGELAGDAIRLTTLKMARDWSLIGKSAPRLDSNANTTGRALKHRQPGRRIPIGDIGLPLLVVSSSSSDAVSPTTK